MNNPDFEINLNNSTVNNQTSTFEVDNNPTEFTIEMNGGARGLKGDKGDTGSQGPQGIQGLQGEQGPAGQDGYSPTATVKKSGSTTTITITDKNGTTTANVYDGSGAGDMLKAVYDTNNDGIVDNAEKVNNHTVLSDVPSDAVFTDTTYTAGTGIDITGNVISNTQTSAEWGNITGDIANQTDLNTALGNKVDSSSLSTVATSGSYTDLSNKPTIPDELADLSDDSTHRVVTDTEKTTWSGKQDTLVSGTNIKTINNTTILGSGNFDLEEKISQQTSAPSNPSTGDLWLDTDDPGYELTVDSTVSTTSINPVENQAITNYVNNLFLFNKTNLTKSNNLSYSNSFYMEIGNLVFVIIADVLVQTAVTGTTTILTGAPAPATDVPFMITRMDNQVSRLHVGTDGNIKTWYTNMAADNNNYWYGFIAYIKA